MVPTTVDHAQRQVAGPYDLTLVPRLSLSQSGTELQALTLACKPSSSIPSANAPLLHPNCGTPARSKAVLHRMLCSTKVSKIQALVRCVSQQSQDMPHERRHLESSVYLCRRIVNGTSHVRLQPPRTLLDLHICKARPWPCCFAFILFSLEKRYHLGERLCHLSLPTMTQSSGCCLRNLDIAKPSRPHHGAYSGSALARMPYPLSSKAA